MPTSLNTSGLYTVRPSIMMSILLAATAAKPRAVMDHVPLLKRATWMPSASPTASASVVTPERRISSPVTTEIAVGAVATGPGRRVASVHIDLHQLLDGQPLEVLRRRCRCGERPGQNLDDGKGGHRVSQARWDIVINLGLSNRDVFQH